MDCPAPCGLALELLELLLRGAMANRVVFFTPGDSELLAGGRD